MKKTFTFFFILGLLTLWSFNAKADVQFFAEVPSNCDPAPVHYENNSFFDNYQGPVTYMWVINFNDTIFAFTPPDDTLGIGSYTIDLYAFDTSAQSLGYNYFYFDVVDCSTIDRVDFFMNFQGNCQPLNVAFENTSFFNNYNGPVTYEWRINGAQFSNAFAPPDTVLNANYYSIELYAYDTSQNIIDVNYKYIDVFDCSGGEYISFYTEQQGTCSGDTVRFYNTTEMAYYMGEVTYVWYANDQVFFNGFEPPAAPLPGGNQNIRLEALDSTGAFLGSYFNDLYINGSTGMFRSSSGDQVCPGENISFWYNESYNTINWDLGDGTIINQNSYVDHVYPSEGTYTVRLVIQPYECPVDTIYRTIVVSNAAVPEIHAFVERGMQSCPLDEIIFNVEGNNPNVSWEFDDGTMLTGQRVSYAFQTTGQHWAVAKVTNACGNSGSDTVFVEVRNDIPVYGGFDWWYEGPNPCPLTPFKFTPYENGNHVWDFGDGATSTVSSPYHAYAAEGTYQVQLISYNGCGYSDTSYNTVNVFFSRGEFYADFEIRTVEDDYFDYYDTLRICPNEAVKFVPYDYENSQLKYTWLFGDGTGSIMRTPVHSWSTGGLKTVRLKVRNNCQDTAIAVRYVLVDPTMMPMSELMHIPATVCPGDKVFFFDMESDPQRDKYKYSIDFGDGSPVVNDITTPEDPKINSLASHVYTGTGPYQYIFTVTNRCNNTDTVSNNIILSPDAGKLPFYYVDNTTSPKEDGNGGNGIADWSVPGPNTHEFIIPVQWYTWPGTENTFFVYFWYGDFYPEGNDDEPAGMVSFTTNNIVNGDSVVAHVPVEITEFHSVGIAAAWYCDAAFSGRDPEVFGMPVDGNMSPINSFPIEPGLTTDLRSIGGSILLDPGAEWDGMCHSNLPEGQFKSPTGDGNAYFVDLWSSDDTTRWYYINMGPEFPDQGSGENMYITDGSHFISNDTIFFLPYDEYSNCPDTAMYTFVYYGDSMMFTMIADLCDSRISALTNGMFYRHYYDEGGNYRYEGCPGDSVEFTVIGGKSYMWNFGDGNTLSTTKAHVKHAYAAVGQYDAYVVITNSCDRVDTIFSPVVIGDQNIPFAYFSMNPWDPFVGDTVTFRYDDYGPHTDNYQFTWNFGDGSPLRNGRIVKHVFKNGGDFFVRLTVKNGCGENTQGYNIWVRGGVNNCDIEARFISEVMNDTVQFYNNSFGDVTNVYWDFGDGTTSNEKDPLHVYANAGVYAICLTVIDSVTQCQSTICQDVWIGNVDCFADFVFSTVGSTNTVSLTDKSIGAASWTWDFGDGSTSSMQNPSHSYKQPGLYTIFLKITNATGDCFSEKGKEIQIGEIDSTYCFPEFGFFVDGFTVTFTDQSLGQITNWYWDFGNGFISNKQSVKHTFAKAGTYQVCLSIYDSVSDCRNLVCKAITVGQVDCQAKFTYFVDASTLSVAFTDKSIGNVSEWLWNFGDGNLSILQNPKYKYSKPGVYEVCLTTYDKATDCLSKICERITVGQVQDCFAEFDYFVDGLTVKFSDKALGSVTSRYWDFGNGTVGFKENPVVTYKKSGIKKVCYLVYDTISGCQSQICKEIKVGSNDCGADFTYFIDQKTKQVNLYNNSFGNVNKWLWDFGNGTISFDTNATITYKDYGVYNICLTASEGVTDGCVSKACKEISLKDTSSNAVTCNARFTYVASEGTRDVTFKDATYEEVTSWFWDFGDGSFAKDSTVKHTYGQDGTYKVCLSIYNATTGCFSENCKEVIVKSASDTIESLDADFTYIPSASSTVVKFLDGSTGNPTNWYWTFGDGSYTKGEQETLHDYGKPGNYMACLYIFDATTGNTSEECKMVPVGEKECVISAQFGKFIDPDTRKVIFSDKSTGNGTKWFWSFGDGTTSTTQNPVKTYDKAGLYLVSLSVRDESGGCSDYVADFIQVGSIDCKASFSYVVNADSNKITLKSTSKGDVGKHFWSFGDGSQGRGSTTTHYYKEGGMFRVALSISTTGGTCTDYYIEPVQVGNVDCSAGFSVYVDSISNTAYFTSKVLGNSTRLLWQFGDGGISTMENPVHTYKAPGYFTVGLNTYDPNSNCMDYSEDLVLIGQRGSDCEADFFYNIDGKNVDFYDNSKGDNLKYYWWFGDGATKSTEADTTVLYADGGYYYVCLTVTTPSGIQNTRCKFIAVEPPAREDCLADFIYTVDSASRKVTFTDKSLGEPNKWIWKFGDDQESTAQNPEHTYAQAGFYNVRLVSGDSTTGCKSRAWQMVNVGQAGDGLRAGFGYELDTLNFKTGGYPVDFVGVSSGKPAKYSWDFGDGETNETNISPTHEYDLPGEYNVCLTVEDQVTEESNQACQMISIEDTSSNNPNSITVLPNQFIDLNSYPNPFGQYNTISYSLPVTARITITIYDQAGRQVTTLVNTTKDAGKHELTWDAANVANGLYYIQLSTSQGIVKTKMIVKR